MLNSPNNTSHLSSQSTSSSPSPPAAQFTGQLFLRTNLTAAFWELRGDWRKVVWCECSLLNSGVTLLIFLLGSTSVFFSEEHQHTLYHWVCVCVWAVCDVLARNPKYWGGQGSMSLCRSTWWWPKPFVQPPTLNTLFTPNIHMVYRLKLTLVKQIKTKVWMDGCSALN